MATAKIDIWMPIYIGDYLRDTQALTAEEHGVYFLLLMHYWQKKGEIGTDVKRLAIVARSDPETTKTILESFFILDGANYKNKRADEELKAAKSRSNAARTNIQKRWNKDGNTGVIPPYKDGNTGGGTESIPIGYSSSPSSSPSLSSKISLPSKKEEEQTPRMNGSKRIEKARALWNDLKAGPPCRLLAITFKPEDTTDCLRVMTAYTDELIAEAMTNYSMILQSSEHEIKSPYQSFVGFIRGGVEKFVSDANPWELFKKRLSFADQEEANTKRVLAEVFAKAEGDEN